MPDNKISPTTPAETNNRLVRLSALFSRVSLLWWVALINLSDIALAETFTVLVEPRVGLVMHGLILLSLMLQVALSSAETDQHFLTALALAPLIRLMSLVLPLSKFPLVTWYMMVGAPLFMAAIFAARAGRLSRADLGLKWGNLPFQFLVSLTGIGLGYLEYRILTPEPLVAALNWEQIWLPALILLVFTGLLEEFVFRGLLQYTAMRSLGWAGLIYSAAVFSVLHMGYKSWQDLVFVFGVALLFGWVVRRSGSILGVSIAHG